MLGEEQLQRFHATRFNDRGQALDAMNIPAPDLACPHCRRKLPQGFLDMPHLIFSIVGAPSSGKSYYLSVLVKILQSALFQNFGITFRDADPSVTRGSNSTAAAQSHERDGRPDAAGQRDRCTDHHHRLVEQRRGEATRIALRVTVAPA